MAWKVSFARDVSMHRRLLVDALPVFSMPCVRTLTLASVLLVSASLHGCARGQAPGTVIVPSELDATQLPEAQTHAPSEDAHAPDADAPSIALPVEEAPLSAHDALILAVDAQQWEEARAHATEVAPDDFDLALNSALIELYIHDGHYLEARQRARELGRANPDQREHWESLYYDAFQADPELWAAEPRALVPGVDFDRLESLGGGSTVTIKVKREDETIAVFKPHSTLGQSYYRGEVAAYRLCELMECGFSVPKNEEVKIKVEDFLVAYGIRSLTRATPGTYARRFSDLIVFTDEEGQDWLYGTLKDWVPGFTTFAVEHTEGWLWLVNGSRSRAQLEAMSLEDALRPMRGKERSYVRAILERAEDTTAIDFARQLSNLHVFDALLNNWDRYSGQFWGVNLQWNHGTFVSIDNGATLQPNNWGSNMATRNRQRRIRTYSRATVDAIRAMDLERMREILLPATPWHPDEEERFGRFIQAREDFLLWLDKEIERRGEDAVLLFD